jgi:hypothetical protein
MPGQIGPTAPRSYTLPSGQTITPTYGRMAGLSPEQFTQAQQQGILGTDPTPGFTWNGFVRSGLAFAAMALPMVGEAIGAAILSTLPAEIAATASAQTVGQAAMSATSGYLSGQSPAQIAQNIASSVVTSGAGQLGQEAGGALGASAARSAVGSTLAGADASTILRNTIAGVAGTGLSELTGSATAGRLLGSEIAKPGDTQSLLQQGFAGLQQDFKGINADQQQQKTDALPEGSPEKAALYSNEGYGGESAPAPTSPISFTSRVPKPRAAPERTTAPAQQTAGADNVTSAPTDTGTDTNTGTQTQTVGTIDTGAAGNLADGLGTSTSRIPGVSTTLGGSLSTARAPGDVSTDPTGGPQKAGWNEKSLRYLLGL